MIVRMWHGRVSTEKADAYREFLNEDFAGEEVKVVKYYPEDKDFLLEFEPTVVHYEVAGQSK